MPEKRNLPLFTGGITLILTPFSFYLSYLVVVFRNVRSFNTWSLASRSLCQARWLICRFLNMIYIKCRLFINVTSEEQEQWRGLFSPNFRAAPEMFGANICKKTRREQSVSVAIARARMPLLEWQINNELLKEGDLLGLRNVQWCKGLGGKVWKCSTKREVPPRTLQEWGRLYPRQVTKQVWLLGTTYRPSVLACRRERERWN